MTASTFEERISEWHDFTQAVRGQSDLGLVLITASFLDNQLRLIIESYLIEGRVKKDLLDGPNAPLGTFSSRIETAYALGLIDDAEYETIQAIRGIRNEFAHNIKTSFAAAKVKGRMDSLAWAINQKKIGKYDSSTAFQLASQRLAMQLLNRADHARAERLKARSWPVERTDADPDFDLY